MPVHPEYQQSDTEVTVDQLFAGFDDETLAELSDVPTPRTYETPTPPASDLPTPQASGDFSHGSDDGMTSVENYIAPPSGHGQDVDTADDHGSDAHSSEAAVYDAPGSGESTVLTPSTSESSKEAEFDIDDQSTWGLALSPPFFILDSYNARIANLHADPVIGAPSPTESQALHDDFMNWLNNDGGGPPTPASTNHNTYSEGDFTPLADANAAITAPVGMEEGDTWEANPVMADFFARFPWMRGVMKIPKKLNERPKAEDYPLGPDWAIPDLDQETPEPPAVKWINSLISLDIHECDDISSEQAMHCPICLDMFFGGEMQELPCSYHVNISSPVEKRAPVNTVKSLAEFLEQVNWMLTGMGPLRLNLEGRQQWDDVRGYVQEHIDEQLQLIEREARLRYHLRQESRNSGFVDLIAAFVPNREERLDLQERISNALREWDRSRYVGLRAAEEEQVMQEVYEMEEMDESE